MENILRKWLAERGGRLHFTLIDPDRQAPQKAGELAGRCASYGTDAIMVGGSTIGLEIADKTTKAIKEKVKLPVILFPNSASALSKHADYIFFMSLLNSQERRFLVGEQVKGAAFVRKYGITPIPMGYLLVSTSRSPTTVEKVANPDRILENDFEKAVAYALTAQYFGMHCVYLEAGSGAEKPVPAEMITEVKKSLEIPVIVGGGIRMPEAASKAVEAGADVVVTGTIAEKNLEILEAIIKEVKGRR